jgi:hypothetical protein
MSALEALDKAKKAGVRITLDGEGFFAETQTPPLPADVVDLLRASKPGIMQILTWREAAREALYSTPPDDCRQDRWEQALHGLRYFVGKGWGDQACSLGWTQTELYRVPPLWARVDLTGAALLIGDRRVRAVTADNIVTETRTGSQNRFRKLGREHLA